MFNKIHIMNMQLSIMLTLIAFNLSCTSTSTSTSTSTTQLNIERTNSEIIGTKTVTEEGISSSEKNSGSAGQEVICNSSQGLERKICDIAGDEWEKYQTDYNPFKITYVINDLNEDGSEEFIIWVSSWSGTSGGNFFILTSEIKGFKKLFQVDMAWSPIIVSDSKTNGWSQVSYLQTGGGLEQKFINLIYKNGRYTVVSSSQNKPEGIVVIGKDWKHSSFGPMSQ